MNPWRTLFTTIAASLVVTLTPTTALAATPNAEVRSTGGGLHRYGDPSGDYADIYVTGTVSGATSATKTVISLYGCGKTAPAVSKTLTGNGDFKITADAHRVSYNVVAKAVVSEVGKDSKTITLYIPDSVRNQWKSTGDANCGTVSTMPTVPKTWVKAWSKKRTGYPTAAKVGKTNAITATTLTKRGKAKHARVTYKWLLTGKAIAGATGRSYTPTVAQAGKVLAAKVYVSRKGFKPRTKVISFGTIAPRIAPAQGRWAYAGTTNYDECGDVEESLFFTVEGSNVVIRNASALYEGTSPTYAMLVSGEATTLPIKDGKVNATLTDVGIQAACGSDIIGTQGTVEISITFRSATSAYGSVTLTDANAAPNGATYSFDSANGGGFQSN